MDNHTTGRISKDKKNQLNLSAPLKKVANKKKFNINLTLYKSIINDHNYLLNSMFNKRYYNINEIYNTAMYNTKTYSTIISKSDLSTLKGTNWLCGDVLNVYLSLVKNQSTLKIFTADMYVFTSFSNNRNKTFFFKK